MHPVGCILRATHFPQWSRTPRHLLWLGWGNETQCSLTSILVGEWSKQSLSYTIGNCSLYAILFAEMDRFKKKFRLTVVQVARGNGKTTLLSGLSLYDLLRGGKRVHVIAQQSEQAEILLETTKNDGSAIAGKQSWLHSSVCFHWPWRYWLQHERSLPALDRSLDGLNPSMWVADENSRIQR